MVLDRFDDNDLYLEAAFAERGLPDIIKIAAHTNDMLEKHAADFALVIDSEIGYKEFKYPIMDAGNAIASAVYFNEFGSSLEPELQKEAANNIGHALASFGFDVPAELTKTAALELGFTGEADDMTLESIFGVTGEKSDVELLKDHFDDSSPRGKQRIAFRVKEAGANHVDLDYARDSVGTDLEFAIEYRKQLVAADSAEETYLDGLLEKSASADVESLIKELSTFDVDNHLTYLYSNGLPDPVKSVLGTELAKEASAVRRINVGDESMLVSDFETKLSGAYDDIGSKFGNELVTQLKSSPELVFNSLPSPHKSAIANILNGE